MTVRFLGRFEKSIFTKQNIYQELNRVHVRTYSHERLFIWTKASLDGKARREQPTIAISNECNEWLEPGAALWTG